MTCVLLAFELNLDRHRMTVNVSHLFRKVENVDKQCRTQLFNVVAFTRKRKKLLRLYFYFYFYCGTEKAGRENVHRERGTQMISKKKRERERERERENTQKKESLRESRRLTNTTKEKKTPILENNSSERRV